MCSTDVHAGCSIHTNCSCCQRKNRSWNMMCYCLKLLWHADVTRMCMCVIWIAVLHKLLWYITVQWTAGLRRTHTRMHTGRHTHTISRIHSLRNHALSISLHKQADTHITRLGHLCVCVYVFNLSCILHNCNNVIVKKQSDSWFLCPDADEMLF